MPDTPSDRSQVAPEGCPLVDKRLAQLAAALDSNFMDARSRLEGVFSAHQFFTTCCHPQVDTAKVVLAMQQFPHRGLDRFTGSRVPRMSLPRLVWT